MIKEKELKELIKQKATVYYICTNPFNSNIKYVQEVSLTNKHTIGLDSWDFSKNTEEDKILKYIYDEEDEDDISYLKDLYKNKEDAEFSVKYQRVPRTEYLDLPTYEEFKYVEFCTNTSKFIFEKVIESFPKYPDFHVEEDVEFLRIWEMTFDDEDYCHYNELSTKDNYLKACELCLQLFKGEDYERED